ncbi:hypothetical protein ACXPVS_11255 [Pseudomonas sp. Ma2-10]
MRPVDTVFDRLIGDGLNCFERAGGQRILAEAFKRMPLLEILAPAAGSSEFDSAADAVS